jgi:hypothetical protein
MAEESGPKDRSGIIETALGGSAMSRAFLRMAGAFILIISSLSLCQTVKKGTLCATASVGYGIGVGGQSIGPSTMLVDGVVNEQTDNYYNLGSGFKFDAGVIAKLMDGLDAQLCFNLGLGLPKTRTYENTSTTNSAANITASHKNSHSQIELGLFIMPRFNALDLIDLYAGVGLGPVFTFSSDEIDSTGDQTRVRKFDNYATVACLSKIGFLYPVSLSLDVYGEVETALMNVTQKGYKLEDANGNPLPGALVYHRDALESGQTPPKIPGSNISIKFGVRLAIL